MENRDEIGDILYQFHRLFVGFDEIRSELCVVDSVNEENRVCDLVTLDNKKLTAVRLESTYEINADGSSTSSDAKGVLVIPKVGSYVIVDYMDKNSPYVSKFSEIDKIISKQGEMILNSDEYGGLVNAKELKIQLDKLQSKVDVIINAITSSAVLAGDGGAVFKTNMTAVLQTAIDADFSNLENEDIKHGSN